MRIALGGDHAGFDLKEALAADRCRLDKVLALESRNIGPTARREAGR